MLLGHIDSFELKLLEKQPVQEGCCGPLLCPPQRRKYISHVKCTFPAAGRETSLAREGKSRVQKAR